MLGLLEVTYLLVSIYPILKTPETLNDPSKIFLAVLALLTLTTILVIYPFIYKINIDDREMK